METDQLNVQQLVQILEEGVRTPETRALTVQLLQKVATRLEEKIGAHTADVGTRAQADSAERDVQFLDRAYFLFDDAPRREDFPRLAVFIVPGLIWWGVYAWGKRDLMQQIADYFEEAGLADGFELRVEDGAFKGEEAWGSGGHVGLGSQLAVKDLADLESHEPFSEQIATELAMLWKRFQPRIDEVRRVAGATSVDPKLLARLEVWKREATDPSHPRHHYADLDWSLRRYESIKKQMDVIFDDSSSVTQEQMAELFGLLNSGQRMKNKVAAENDLAELHRLLAEMRKNSDDPTAAIERAVQNIRFAGWNMLGELYGWVHPENAPLYNQRATAALNQLGFHFDPSDYDAFCANHEQFRQIYQKYVGHLRPELPLNLEIDKFYYIVDELGPIDIDDGNGLEGNSYLPEHFVVETHLLPETRDELLALLHDKKQLVLYGPPGTGKTYIAHRLGRLLTGLADPPPSRLEMIQFHPAYSYEDFIEGIRPRATTAADGRQWVEYPVQAGVFRRFCERAARRSAGEPHVFIVDEINRGNIARIFGELMLLLEYRDQSVPLPYSGNRFRIPPNVYLIGTMNTADRSIALVDFALRRRFHFFECAADPDLFARWLGAHAPDLPYLETLYRRLATEAIEEPDYRIGPSYFMDPALTEAKLARIWRRSIMPYLREYYVDQPARAQRWAWNGELVRGLRGAA